LCRSGWWRWYMVAELRAFTVAMAAVVLLALVRWLAGFSFWDQPFNSVLLFCRT
jgi:hypothetical protein